MIVEPAGVDRPALGNSVSEKGCATVYLLSVRIKLLTYGRSPDSTSS